MIIVALLFQIKITNQSWKFSTHSVCMFFMFTWHSKKVGYVLDL